MSKASEREKQECIQKLRELIKPGDTVYTILDHVSSSGMTRHIRVLVPVMQGENGHSQVDFIHPNYNVGKALGYRQAKRGDGLVVSGCGMDMGFALVYELGHVLYGEGYQCLGNDKCPSSYHSNHRDKVPCQNHCRFDQKQRAWLYYSEGSEDPEVCTKCVRGYIPNPEGPQRFDLIHKDGYALRHKWL